MYHVEGGQTNQKLKLMIQLFVSHTNVGDFELVTIWVFHNFLDFLTNQELLLGIIWEY